MNILHAIFDNKFALIGDVEDILQFCEELCQLIFLQESDAFEHGDVRHTSQHVIFGEIEVELTVASYSKSFDFLVYFKVLFPKFMCHNCIFLLILIWNHRQGVCNLFDAFLQWLLHHTLDKHVELSLDGELHLA